MIFNMLNLNIPILSLLIWTPLIGGILLLFIDQKNDSLIKLFGFTFSALTFFISIILLINFDASQYLLQFVEKRTWITTLNIQLSSCSRWVFYIIYIANNNDYIFNHII